MKKAIVILLHLLYWFLVVIFFLKYFELDLGFIVKEKNDFFWPVVYGAFFNAVIFYGTCFWLIPAYLNSNNRQKFYFLAFIGFLVVTFTENIIDIWWIKEVRTETYNTVTPSFVFWTTWFFNAVINALYYLFAFGYRLPIDKRAQERREAQLEKEKLAAELKFLKAQIDPHTLFNGMNSIYHLIDQNPEKAKDIVLKFSDLIRYQLYECDDDFIELEQELKYLNNYLAINQIRKEEDAVIKVNISQESDNVLIVPLVFTAFVENAFKYLSSHSDPEQNILNLELSNDDDFIHFKVSNTVDKGVKISEEKAGIGIKNTVNRLKLLYGEKYDLKYGMIEEEYHVSLKLPVREFVENNLPVRQ